MPGACCCSCGGEAHGVEAEVQQLRLVESGDATFVTAVTAVIHRTALVRGTAEQTGEVGLSPDTTVSAGGPVASLLSTVEAREVSYRGELVSVVRSRRFSVDGAETPIWRAEHKGRIGSGITPEDAAREVCR